MCDYCHDQITRERIRTYDKNSNPAVMMKLWANENGGNFMCESSPYKLHNPNAGLMKKAMEAIDKIGMTITVKSAFMVVIDVRRKS